MAGRTSASQAAAMRAGQADEADLSTGAAEQAHRYSGAVGIGPAADTVDLDRAHDRCVTYCLSPGQRRRGARCPSCYGQVAIRDLATAEDIPPAGSRLAWLLAYWLAGWAAAWRDATLGMVIDDAGTGGDPDRDHSHTDHHDQEVTRGTAETA